MALRALVTPAQREREMRMTTARREANRMTATSQNFRRLPIASAFGFAAPANPLRRNHGRGAGWPRADAIGTKSHPPGQGRGAKGATFDRVGGDHFVRVLRRSPCLTSVRRDGLKCVAADDGVNINILRNPHMSTIRSHISGKRALGTAAIAGAVAATIFGQALRTPSAVADTPKRLDNPNIARVDELASAMKEVGKRVEPGVVSINVEKTGTRGGRGEMNEDMLRQFFPDRDGDGEPDVPPGFRFRFGPGGGNGGQRGNPGGDNDGEASPEDAIPGPRVFGEGSGVILDATADKAYILTNNHVAGDATKLTVTLSDGRKIEDVTVVGTDPLSDLAVLEIKAEGLKAVAWGDSSTLDKGDIVLAFGAPFGYVGSMTQGIVSALNRQANLLGQGGYENFIQTDCAINPGNSGGPLVNIHGEIVGINTAIASRSGGFNGIGFAIPSEMAKFVYTQIKEKGRVERGFLGVKIGEASALPKSQAKMLGLGNNPTGAFVSVLQNDTPAAGKLQPNDVIVRMNGKPIATMQELRIKIATTPPGQTVKLGVIRGGKEQEVDITLGTLPDANAKVASKDKPKEQAAQTPQFGVSLSDANPARLKALGLPADVGGALVTGVKNGSPAQQAGLANNDLITQINGKDVKDAAEATALLKDAKLADGVNLIVKTKDGTKSVFMQSDGN
jgi:serine protease Do